MSYLSTLNQNGRVQTHGGVLDGSSSDPNQLLRIAFGTAVANGVNSTRAGTPNSITDDSANGAGASFFANLYYNSTHATEGSFQNIWSQMTLNEDPGGSDRYAEGLAFFGTVTSNRRGALAIAMEGGVTVATGKPSRAIGGHFLITENNPIADYATYLGGSSLYAKTGAIGVRITQSGGSQYVGTGLHVGGNFLSSLRVHNGDVANKLLSSKVSSDSQYAYQIDPRGKTEWGDGASAVDTNLYRSDVSRLKTDSLFYANVLGLGTKVKAGAPVDGDWASPTPVDGVIVGDTTNNKLWMRLGGTWKGVVLT